MLKNLVKFPSPFGLVNLKIFGMSKANIFLLFLILFISGIGIGSFIPISFFILYLLSLVGVFALFWFWKNKKARILIFGLLILVAGVFRYELSSPRIDERHISFYNDQEIIFQARVVKEPVVKIDKVQLTVEAERLDNTPLRGKVLVTLPLYSHYEYDDILEIQSTLREPKKIEGFDYHEYLARYGVYSICYYPEIKLLARGEGNFFYGRILWVKNKVKNLIRQNFTEPQGTIISAMLLGDRYGIPRELRDEFSRAGIAHILAVSGLHISTLCLILSAFFISALSIRRQRAFYLTLASVCAFVILAGAPASAVRAAIMGLGLAYAEKIGRPGSFLRILILACALMLLVNPKLLKADLGFQLSFMACLGISLFSQHFRQFLRYLPRTSWLPLPYYLSITLAAQIFVFPLVLYRFGNLSLIAFLANILVLPVLSFVMISGFIFSLGGLIWPVLAKILVWPCWIGLTYITGVAKVLSSIPGFSFIFGQVHPIIVIILYLLIGFFLVKLYQKKEKNEITE